MKHRNKYTPLFNCRAIDPVKEIGNPNTLFNGRQLALSKVDTAFTTPSNI